jgi:hydroxymethylpyrimidine kinase/phosphomethylpyrimidine kinase
MPLRKSSEPRPPRTEVPCVLTIAGSDSGGGAGIQADLKTFAALGVHGASAITCVTAQNPKKVRSVQALRPRIVRDQIEVVAEGLRPRFAKTGMLYSTEIIRAVAAAARELKLPLVVDPVMIATSGAVLLKMSAIRALLEEIFPLAVIITPNLDEAQFILGTRILEPEDARAAAREIHARFGCAALVKGGHLRGIKSAIDFFCDGKTEQMLEAPFRRGLSNHGTGCVYSAAITAHLALGRNLLDAVSASKEFISNAIAASHRCAGHAVLNSFWRFA